MTRTTFGKLALVLAMIGALALAGCGGDDNGLSSEDMARITAADDAAKMAQADADAAKAAADKAAADLKAAEEMAAADKAAADAAIAEAQADADAAQMAADAAMAAVAEAKMDAEAAQADADAAQMEAEAAQEDAEAAQMAADAARTGAAGMVYEDIFASTLERELSAAVAGNPAIATIRDAIIQLGLDYGAPYPNTAAGLDAELAAFFGNEVPTAQTAVEFLAQKRAGGYLPASRVRVLAILDRAAMMAQAAADTAQAAADTAQDTADTAQDTADTAQDTADAAEAATTDDVDQYKDIIAGDVEGDRQTDRDYTRDPETRFQWEVVFTPHLEARFLEIIPADPTIAQIRDAIRQIAGEYQEPHPYTRAGLESDMHAYFGADPTAGTALAYFRQLRLGNRSVQREGASSAAYEFLAATRQRYEDARPTAVADNGNGDDTGGNGNGNGNGDDAAEPGTLAALLMDEDADVVGRGSTDPMDFALPAGTRFANEGGGIQSFSERVGDDFGGFGDDTFETMGLWADGVAAFAVLSGEVGMEGLEIDTAHIGVPADPPTGRASGRAFWLGKFTGVHTSDPDPAFDVGTNTVGENDAAMGDVRFDVTFDDNGDASTMNATFDKFVGEATHEHTFMGIVIGRRGAFTASDTTTENMQGSIDGQFYEASNGPNVGGNMMLTTGLDDNGDPDGTLEIGGVAADYAISGVYVATE